MVNSSRVTIIFTIALIIFILSEIIFMQGKKINTQKELIQMYTRQPSPANTPPDSVKREAKAETRQMYARIKGLQESRLAAIEELSRLKEEVESGRYIMEKARQAQEKARQAQEKARKTEELAQQKSAGLEGDNSILRAELERLRSDVGRLEAALAEKMELEANAHARKPASKFRAEREMEKFQKKNERLSGQVKQLKAEKADLESRYAGLKKINYQLEEKTKTLFLKAKDKEQLELQVKELNDAAAALAKERRVLLAKIRRLEEQTADLRKERESLYWQAADALMRSGYTEEAIGQFNKALQINPRNAEAHYKLGFLYKRSLNNNLRAVYHFRKYLALAPDAKNRKEAEYLIKMFSQYDWKNTLEN